MKDVEQRRFVPISITVITCIALLGVLQLFVVTGGLEIKSSWVQQKMPWAYEPYLRLVGEHPDAIASRLEMDQATKEQESSSGIGAIAGFAPEDLGVSLDNTTEMPTNGVIVEPSSPVQDAPEEDPADAVPVG
jgi:hypothetical protein